VAMASVSELHGFGVLPTRALTAGTKQEQSRVESAATRKCCFVHHQMWCLRDGAHS